MTSSRPLALVTGASGGIGAVFARKLADAGYDLVLVARRKERLEALERELASRCSAAVEVLVADLATEAGLLDVEQRIAGAGNLEFLVNNAGFGVSGRFIEADAARLDEMHRLHVLATVRLTRTALPGMVARGKGNLINVSSVAAFVATPGSTGYSATKTWMNAFTEGVYLELASTGSKVKVQALCPGFTLTEFHDVMGVDRKLIPAALWMKAEDVVEASFRGLARGTLFVVPGLRYRLLVLFLRLLPRELLHAGAMLYSRKLRR